MQRPLRINLRDRARSPIEHARSAAALFAAAAFSTAAIAQQREGVLEEVLVTAQFREERLQTTPLAITAMTAETIEARSLSNSLDLDAFVPNAVIQPLGAGWGSTMAAFIRGVGLGDNILSFEPGVPIYIDDVYHGRPQGAIFDLLDLERVEVLRGPQGTLFGKNAIGGTIRLISKRPQGDGSGSASLTIGSFNRIDARASADVSLVENKVFARFAFSSKQADGFFKVLDYECVNGAGSLGNGGAGLPDSGGPVAFPGGFPGGLPGIRLGSQTNSSNCVVDTLNDEDVQSARGAFRFILSEDVEFNLIGDVTNQRQKGPGDKYTVIDGTNGLNAFWNAAFAGPVFGAGVGWDDRFVTDDLYTNYSRFDDPVTHRAVPNINDLEHWGVSGTLEWQLSQSTTLKSVTAYREFWNKFGRDSDGSPLPNNATYDESRHRQLTQEIQLTGTAGKLDWATGVFYYDAHDSNRGFDFLYPTIVYQNDAYDVQDTENWAIFAHGVYHFTDQLSVTGGIRYTDDEKTARINRTTFFGVTVIDDAVVPVTANNTDVNASVDYQWSDTVMTYLKYSTGFKGGGFSPRPSTELQTDPFDPEELKNYEIGVKSEWFDRRIRLNGALFRADYRDQQTFSQQLDSSGANWFRTQNAGKARIWGVEAEMQAEPVDDLRIEAAFGYINYDLYDNEGNTLLLEGNECAGGRRCYSPRTPKYNGALGLQYSMDAAGGTITPRIDAQYQSTIYFTTNNGGQQEAYWLLNGRLTWLSPDEDWEVAVYGRNLTEEEYFSGKLSLVGFFGREQGNPGAPREWGVTFTRNF
jgi:iron complex outermembrane receptor protein